MPTYKVTDSKTGMVLQLTGMSPPTESELTEIFAAKEAERQAVPREKLSYKPSGEALTPAQRRGQDIPLADITASVIEPAATMITGAIAEPIAGLVGIAKTITSGPEAGAATVEAVREGLTFQPRTEAGREGLKTVGTLLEPLAEALQGAEKSLGDAAYKYTGSPALAALAATLPTAAIEAIGVGAAKGWLKVPGKANRIAKKEIKAFRKSAIDSAPDINAIRNTERALYKEIDDSNIGVRSNEFNPLSDRITNKVKRAGFDPTVSPKTDAIVRKIASEKGQTHTFSEIDALRNSAKLLTKTADKADARLGKIIVDEIDSFLDNNVNPNILVNTRNLSDTNLLQNKKIFVKYEMANELSNRAKRSELITDAFEKANASGDVIAALSNEFKKIAKDKKNLKQFTPGQMQAIKEVSEGTTAINAAKLVGRLGLSEGQYPMIKLLGAGLGFGTSGPIGAATFLGVGEISKRTASQLLKNKSKLADALVRAGDNADIFIKEYKINVKPAQRTSKGLSEILLREDKARTMVTQNVFDSARDPLVREAAEIAKGAMLLQAATLVAPGVIQTQRQEDPRATLKLGLAPE